MTSYSLLYDDGAHCNHLENFNSLEDANKAFLQEVSKFNADPAGYSQDDPSNWDDDFYPHLEIAKFEGDELVDSVNCFSTLLGFDIEPKND